MYLSPQEGVSFLSSASVPLLTFVVVVFLVFFPWTAAAVGEEKRFSRPVPLDQLSPGVQWRRPVPSSLSTLWSVDGGEKKGRRRKYRWVKETRCPCGL